MDVSTPEQLFLFSSDNRDDQLPRMCVLAFLCHLDSSNLQHQRLMEEVAMELLKKVHLALSGSQQWGVFCGVVGLQIYMTASNQTSKVDRCMMMGFFYSLSISCD